VEASKGRVIEKTAHSCYRENITEAVGVVMRTVALQLHAKYPNSFVQPINDALLFSGFL